MSIEVVCDCGRKITAGDDLAGKRVRCPQCKQPVAIPASGPGGAPTKAGGSTVQPKPPVGSSPARKGPPAPPEKASSIVRKGQPAKPASGTEEEIPVIRAKKKKKNKANAGANRKPLILAAALAGLVVAAGVVWVAGTQLGWFGTGPNVIAVIGDNRTSQPGAGPSGPKPGTLAALVNSSITTDETLFIPPDSVAVLSMQVSSMLRSPLGSALIKAGGMDLESIKGLLGIDPDKITRMHLVFNTQELSKASQMLQPPAPGGPGGMPGRGQKVDPQDQRHFVNHSMDEDESKTTGNGVLIAQAGAMFLPGGAQPGVPAGGFPNPGGQPGGGGPGRPGMGGPGMGGPGMGGPGMGGPGMGGSASPPDFGAMILLFSASQNWATPPAMVTKESTTVASAPGESFKMPDGSICHLCPGGRVMLLGSKTGLEMFLNQTSGTANAQVAKVKALLAQPDNHLVLVSGTTVPGMPTSDPSALLPPAYAYLKPMLAPMQGLTLTGKVTEDISMVLTASYADEASAKLALPAAKKGAGEVNNFQNKTLLTALSLAAPGPQGKAIGLLSDALGQLKPVQEGSTLKQTLILKGAKIKALIPAGPASGVRPGTAPAGSQPGASGPRAGGSSGGGSSGGSGGAVQQVRNAAIRVLGQNEMKQVAIAINNMSIFENSLPSGAICDPSGKPLLSWRVAILPFIDQDNLYKQFHLNEPWDSQHNKQLLNSMPKVYGSEAGGHTAMRAFVGPGCAMELNRKVKLSELTDGTSTTAMVAEAGETVEWTRPEELFIGQGLPFPSLGVGTQTTVNVLFVDGSIKRVPRNYTPQQWIPLITRAGGEMVTLP